MQCCVYAKLSHTKTHNIVPRYFPISVPISLTECQMSNIRNWQAYNNISESTSWFPKNLCTVSLRNLRKLDRRNGRHKKTAELYLKVMSLRIEKKKNPTKTWHRMSGQSWIGPGAQHCRSSVGSSWKRIAQKATIIQLWQLWMSFKKPGLFLRTAYEKTRSLI